ncbi:MAG: flavodoxin domain-containing protein [Anaerolineales bacterium]|jgi:menaquinone-dependent protoporphyrinogen oxidase
MPQKILVTYASRTGSTAEVAELVVKTLADRGMQVDLSPVQDVVDLTPYGAVVAGSAIQNQHWLPEAVQFVETYQAELTRKPFAVFSLCMTLAMRNGEKYRPQVSDWLHPIRDLVPPFSEGLFAGILDIQKIPSSSDRLKFRLSVLFRVWTEGDHRDWDAIRTWIDDLYQQLVVLESNQH